VKPNPILIDKDQVRMMVADLGYQETSARTGIAYATLRQWAKRRKWNHHVVHSQAVTTVTRPIADAHADALKEYEGNTRLSLAKGIERIAKDAEQATLRDVDKVHKAAQAMAIIHRQGEHGSSPGFTLNVLNMGEFEVTMRDPGAQE
jgi:hypothetical protein